MDQKPSFSLFEFKNWLSTQGDLSDFFNISSENSADEQPNDRFIGHSVIVKVSERKLLEKIETEEGDVNDLVQDLVENGGVIIGSDGKNLLIEVESGSFYLPRFCVRIKKD